MCYFRSRRYDFLYWIDYYMVKMMNENRFRVKFFIMYFEDIEGKGNIIKVCGRGGCVI